MLRVMIESPYAGDLVANAAYLAECIHHSIELGEAPFASHGFYVLYLDDSNPEQRKVGMACRHAWAKKADVVRFYCDRGFSAGMWDALGAVHDGQPVEFVLDGEVRTIPGGSLRWYDMLAGLRWVLEAPQEIEEHKPTQPCTKCKIKLNGKDKVEWYQGFPYHQACMPKPDLGLWSWEKVGAYWHLQKRGGGVPTAALVWKGAEKWFWQIYDKGGKSHGPCLTIREAMDAAESAVTLPAEAVIVP